MKLTPRYYQDAANQALDDAVERNIRRNALVMATGVGKTLTTAFRIRDKLEQNKRSLVLLDQRNLAWQWKDDLMKVIPDARIGIEMANYSASKMDDIVIATPQTLGRKGQRRIKKFDPNSFKNVICDEAHKSPVDTWIRCLEYFGVGESNFHDDKELTGLTATFMRSSDEKALGRLYDDIAYKYSIKEALGDGWLTDIEHYPVTTKTDISDIPGYKDDFNITQLGDRLNNPVRNSLIVKSYLEISPGEKAICYTANVKHAYDLREVFKKYGVRAEVIEAHTDSAIRKEYEDNFKDPNGDIDVLINYATLTTGFNAPEATTLILARPIRSAVLYIQIIGRGLRPNSQANVDLWSLQSEKDLRRIAIELSSKPACKLIDLCDVWGSHQIMTPASLFGLRNDINTREKKKIFKEVVEPLEEIKIEKGVDISNIVDINDIDMIVKRQKVDITKFKTPVEIQRLTNLQWLQLENGGYEISFPEEDKVLIIEKDESKKLIQKEGFSLIEYDMNNKIHKELNTFNSLEGAFNIADQYIERQGWDTSLKERRKWMEKEPTEPQIKALLKLYTYRKGTKNEYCEFDFLKERYDDTGYKKMVHKDKVVDREIASTLIDRKYNKHKYGN